MRPGTSGAGGGAAARRKLPALQIPQQRLQNQHITRPHGGSPADVVSYFGAVQAQEYPFAKWALGLRLKGKPADADVEAAIDRGDILRTHVLRPTWHFVAAADIRWMQQLTAPRVHARLATYFPRLGVDPRSLPKAARLIERSLRDGRYLTRPELQVRLAKAGIDLRGTSLAMVVMYAELEGVICSGPRRGREVTYALIDERATKLRELDGDEALAELARRYFVSHGPATIRDFVWWSSLTTADARRGVQMIKAESFEQDGFKYWTVGGKKPALRSGTVHLLPIYDEYVIAYRDRVAVPHAASLPAFGSLVHALVIDGLIAGTWTTDRARNVTIRPVRRLSSAERAAIDREVARFRAFATASAATPE